MPTYFYLFLLFLLLIFVLSGAVCDHEKKVSTITCIESVVGEGNSEHFFVATQDADIRKKFQEVPGIPVIYGLRNSLFIKQPSAFQRECVKSSQAKRLHVNESEYQKLLKRELQDEFANDSGGKVLEEALRKINTAKRMLDVAERSKFKRKKAKGPNPLSCKKKKMKDDSSVTLNEDGQAGAAKKRKRIRPTRTMLESLEVGRDMILRKQQNSLLLSRQLPATGMELFSC